MKTIHYMLPIIVVGLLCSCDLEKAADKASKNLADGVEKGLKGINTDVLKIDAGKQDAVALDRLRRGEDSIIVQVTECVGTFKIKGSLHTESAQEGIWTIRVSDILDTGARPVPPTAPDPAKLKGLFAYPIAKKNYDDKMAAYKNAAAKWEKEFGRKLSDNGIDIAPNFGDAGLYGVKLIIIPEAETKENWKFRIATRLESTDGKSKQFKVYSVEKRDFQNHPLGEPLPEHLLLFNAK